MESVELLQTLLRIRSVNPPGDETAVVEALDAYLADAGLTTEVLVSDEGRANLIARLEGPRDRPALILLSHGDVVPVEEDRWSRDPFGGEIGDGFIWGRGALDMKSIAVMHAVAVGALARSGGAPSREVIVVVAADEEAGGQQGARWLLDRHAERVGFGNGRPAPEVIGEGAYGLSGILERPVIPTAVGEKTAVTFDIIAEGDPGHGALPPQRQAPVKLASIVTDVAGFGTPRVHPVMRAQFETLASVASGATSAVLKGLASPLGSGIARGVAPRLRKEGPLGLLLSDSITPTQISAGYKSNVVPGQARASFDARLLPDTDIDLLIATLDKRAGRHGGRVANVAQKGHGPVSEKTPLLTIIESVSRQLAPGAAPTVTLSPGITDLRFFRARGAIGYGWVPLVLTPDLLATVHGHDERVEVADFENGVAAMTEVVAQAAT